jgi:hypothetical protein
MFEAACSFKVERAQTTLLSEHEIARLAIAPDPSGGMDRGQNSGQLDAQLQRGLDWQPPSAPHQETCKISPFNKLHCHEFIAPVGE